MTLAADMQKVLATNASQLPNVEVNNIHSYNIPINDWTTDKPIFLITEIANNDVEFGDNDPVVRQAQVQIQIYYPKDYSQDMDLLEQNLKNILRTNGWYCFSDTGHFLTPDDNQILVTMKFNQQKIN